MQVARIALVFVMLGSLSGCGVDAADVVASTRHCGSVPVGETSQMRLSKYSAGMPSDDVFVIQACHSERGCNAVFTFMDALGPIYSRTSQGALRIELFGGQILDDPPEKIWIDGVETPLEVTQHSGRQSRAQLDAFRARMGLPPGNVHYQYCDAALDVRPSHGASRPT